MSGPMSGLIVEVLGRGGQVLERIHPEGNMVRIGRAYDNDVIIADPYVSPHHLQLRFEEARGWLAQDLDSDNGTLRRLGAPLTGPTPLAAGAEFIVGRTHVRVSTPSQPVPPTRKLNPAIDRLARLGKPLPLALLVLAAWGSESLSTWLNSTKDTEPAKLAAGGLVLMLMALAWTGLWAFIARVVSHRTHFPAQLGAVAMALLAANVMTLGLEYVEFWTSSPLLREALLNIGIGLLLAGMLYANISLAIGPPRAVALAWAHGGGWLVVAISLLFQIANRPDFDWSPNHSTVLKPPAWYWATPPPPASLAEGMDEVFDGLQPATE